MPVRSGSAYPDIRIRISRWTAENLPSGLSRLAKMAQDEGYLFIVRLQDEWLDGSNRFAGPSECLFIAEASLIAEASDAASDGDGTRSAETTNDLVGIAGISRDPYQTGTGVGRVRHVYVDKPYRSQGIARELVRACLSYSSAGFRIIRLSTSNPVAARLYERLGFQAATAAGERMTHLLQPDAHISN
jgi:ribosomal protein S18 acetylase RimI-like enzyme